MTLLSNGTMKSLRLPNIVNFSQKRHPKNKNILIGGQTNRAQLNFEKEILEIILSVKDNYKIRAERLELSQ